MYPETAEKLLQSLFCESLSLHRMCIVTYVHVYCLFVCLFVCLFAVEDQLCDEIRKLQHYRENGITTFKGRPQDSNNCWCCMLAAM